MSQQDNFQERTEQATPKRLQDARRKGNVARSRELSATAVMLAGSVFLLLAAGPLVSTLVAMMSNGMQLGTVDLADVDAMAEHLAMAARQALRGALPLFAVLALAALGSSVALGGWSFSPSALAFKAERISVVKGIKRVFGARGLMELVKALAKFSVVAVIAVIWLRLIAGRLVGLGSEHPQQALVHAAWLCGASLLVVSLGLILIAAVDAPFQVWQHRRNLKMTRQEVRDEQKETDGKPEVKQRVRQLQQELAGRRMMDAVPEATVVITNPTHFAVAIRYDDKRDQAPVVVAKGVGLIALAIRERAAECDIPLFEAPPLARVLYRTTDLEQPIPFRLYTAVAQVLAYVMQIREAARPWLIERPEPDVDEAGFGRTGETAS